MFISIPFVRGLLAGLAGGIAWFVGLLLFFGPAQSILADPSLQSPKMLAAFTTEPLPRIGEAPWLLPLGLLCIGILWGWIYVWHFGNSPQAWWKRGLRFGTVAWVLMVPWFLFYLPWNVMREPAALAAIEALCWAGVMLLVGITISGTDAVLGRKRSTEEGG